MGRPEDTAGAGQVRRFEDRRWSAGPQVPAWRHRVAVELVRAEPVCDVGGGDGLLAAMLGASDVTDVVLVDVSPVAVERARSRGVEATVGDLLTGLPFDDGAFGTACALDVLEHLLDPLPALRELSRVAREVVIAVPNFNSLRARVDVARGRVPFQNRPARGHCYWFNETEFRGLIRDAGLEVREWRVEPSTRLRMPGRTLASGLPGIFAVSFAARLGRG